MWVARLRFFSIGFIGLCATVLVGCNTGAGAWRGLKTPVQAGKSTNNLIDPIAQADADDLGNPSEWFATAERLRKQPTPEQLANRKAVLCLSGGGSFGAFTAGVMCGWTETGDRPGTNGRPNFDVVTGISTGALIAPLVFLGPQYDAEVKKFYTTVEARDIYR
jgi:predicted acylesterase/phospholipase RssA